MVSISGNTDHEELKFRTKIEKLQPVLRRMNLVIAILEVRLDNESGGIASL